MENKDRTSIYPSEEVVLEELRQQRSIQKDSIGALDGKLATLFGVNGAIFSIFLAGVGIAKLRFTGAMLIAVIVAAMFLFLGFLSALIAYWTRYYRFDPSPSVLVKDYLIRPSKTYDAKLTGAISQICADIAEAYRVNQMILEAKANLIKFCLTFEAVGLTLVAVILIISLLRGG